MTTKTPTLKAVRLAMLHHLTTDGHKVETKVRVLLIAVLAEFNALRASDIKPCDRAAFIKRVKQIGKQYAIET